MNAVPFFEANISALPQEDLTADQRAAWNLNQGLAMLAGTIDQMLAEQRVLQQELTFLRAELRQLR